MSWPKRRLGNLVALQRGHDLPEYRRQPGPVPVIGSAGPNGFHNEAKQSGPGVTVGRSGASIGNVTYVNQEYWPHNTCLYVTDFKGNYPRFVAYLLSTLNLGQLNSGTAQPSLNRNFVYGLNVRFPKPEKQKRIANILSAYDDLIENNRRRVTLLEGAAREIYREWFVRLRFPGHADRKAIDGLPAGWERTALRNIGQLMYGKALKAGDRVQGEYPVYGSSGIVGTHEKAHVPGPGIIIGRKGNVGSVYWSDEDFWPIDTVYFLEPSAVTLHFYYALQNVDFINTDVAVPGLNRNFAYSREFLVPSDQARDVFDNIAKPLHDQISLLRKENEKLSLARDLLLPRLMDGRIQV